MKYQSTGSGQRELYKSACTVGLSEERASRHAASDLESQTGHPGTSGNVEYTGEQGRIPGFCIIFRLSIYVRYFSYLP